MTLLELKEHFYISSYKHEGKFLFYDKEINSGKRSVYKYLCQVKKIGKSFQVENFKPTTKLDILKSNIEAHVKSLEFDSDYYQPQYREGIFEEFIVNDHLQKIGFKYSGSGFGSETYKYDRENVYGKDIDCIISIDGLSAFVDVLPETIKILYHSGDYSWVSINSKRNAKDIITAIDSLLKPLFITESIANLNTADKLTNDDLTNLDLMLEKVSNMTVTETSYKQELKEKLLKLANSL